MGEAKRRQKLDPNFGKSNVLGNACRHIDELLFQPPMRLISRRIQFLLTNFSNRL